MELKSLVQPKSVKLYYTESLKSTVKPRRGIILNGRNIVIILLS